MAMAARPMSYSIASVSRHKAKLVSFAPLASSSISTQSTHSSKKLVLYSKPGCCLCDGLKEKLQSAFSLSGPDSLHDVDLQIRDITSNPEWERAYQYEIPVLARVLADGTELHTKKRNKLDHQRLNDLVYIQYNKRLKRRYESRFSGPESDPIVLDNLDACIEWLVPHDSRKDPVMGTDFNWGMLEEAEGSEHDEPSPPTTRQYKRRRVSQSQPEKTSTSRGGRGKGKGVASRLQLLDSSTDEDESAIVLSDKSDDEDDGLHSGEKEDL